MPSPTMQATRDGKLRPALGMRLSIREASLAIGRNVSYVHRFLEGARPTCSATATRRRGAVRVLRVRGESMKPELSEGDRLLVKRVERVGGAELNPGLRLKSTNVEYTDYTASASDINIVQGALGRAKRVRGVYRADYEVETRSSATGDIVETSALRLRPRLRAGGKSTPIAPGGLTNSNNEYADLIVAGSPGRRVAGSPGRRVAGSPGRRVAGSPGRRVAGSPGRRVAGS